MSRCTGIDVGRIHKVKLRRARLVLGLATTFGGYSPNSTWLVTSRLDTTRDVRRVEPMRFGCVELVKQHGSKRSSRHVERVVSCRDVTSQVEY